MRTNWGFVSLHSGMGRTHLPVIRELGSTEQGLSVPSPWSPEGVQDFPASCCVSILFPNSWKLESL